jgi:hypothetical protein
MSDMQVDSGKPKVQSKEIEDLYMKMKQ